MMDGVMGETHLEFGIKNLNLVLISYIAPSYTCI